MHALFKEREGLLKLKRVSVMFSYRTIAQFFRAPNFHEGWKKKKRRRMHLMSNADRGPKIIRRNRYLLLWL